MPEPRAPLRACISSIATRALRACIVSYNTRADLLACLASIYDAPPARAFSVVVVDNGSRDGSVEAVLQCFPQVEVIAAGENLGYGRGNNRGLLGRAEEFAFYAVLNSDLALHPGSLESCCAYLERHSKVGIVGGGLLEPDSGEPQRDWAAGELDLRAIAFEQFFLAAAFPRSAVFADYFRGAWNHTTETALPQVCGAFMVIRAELYERLGGFDPGYFMYAEDTDFCRRVRLAGFSCVYLPDAPAVHGHGKSSASSALRPQMVLEHNVSRIRYMRKFYGVGSAVVARLIMCLGSLLRVALWSVAGGLLRRPALVEKGTAYRAVLRGTSNASIDARGR